ncbi:hypothetical protein LTS08_006457 [Lithohypha guttulata]|nr:hypothetical protein LTS08_006457 [Lithohypha guttulata]
MSQPQLRKPHGSIPGYRPGPILSRNHKILLWSLLIAPGAAYGFLKLRQQGRKEQEKSLEAEGRAMFEQKYGRRAGQEVKTRPGLLTWYDATTVLCCLEVSAMALAKYPRRGRGTKDVDHDLPTTFITFLRTVPELLEARRER